MKYQQDKRTVLTLDAGGTNFVFSAVRANEEIVAPVRSPSYGNQLDRSLRAIVEGFQNLIDTLEEKPVAISFAFPGPADYPRGIIGDLFNLPGYRGGVALGPMLEDKFDLPVFINNDGDLFAYGEALAGFLPQVNEALASAQNPMRYHNLFGVTLGTGFGGGLVSDDQLLRGDNSMASEVWLMRHKNNSDTNAEEGVSIRAARRTYAELTQTSFDDAPSPKEIYEIGMGQRAGHADLAREAYRRLGEVLGDALANILTIADGLVVIGGGIAGAKELIVPAMLAELRSDFVNYTGECYPRLSQKVYYLDDENEMKNFVKNSAVEIEVPLSNKKLRYDPAKRVGIGFSKLGTSKAIALGAYAYALNALDS
jgi:glucokinase